jgi:hypothetical protein
MAKTVPRNDGLCFILMKIGDCIQKGFNGMRFGGSNYKKDTKEDTSALGVVKSLLHLYGILERL